MLATIVPLLLAAAAPSAAQRTEIETTVVGIYKPYTAEGNGTATWDLPIWSAEVTALVARWEEVRPEGELDEMNDGDWLCQCQDWDARAFQATIVSIGMTNDTTAEVEMRVDLGGDAGALRTEHLTFKREDGVWKIDDLVAEDFPAGIKQELRETIAEDEALAGKAG